MHFRAVILLGVVFLLLIISVKGKCKLRLQNYEEEEQEFDSNNNGLHKSVQLRIYDPEMDDGWRFIHALDLNVDKGACLVHSTLTDLMYCWEPWKKIQFRNGKLTVTQIPDWEKNLG